MPRRTVLIVLAILVVMFLAWDQWRRRPAVQVPGLFIRLAQAVDDRDAADVLLCVDQDYDFAGKWPDLFTDPKRARGEAQRLLALAFFHTRSEDVRCTWTVHAFTAQVDGDVSADVSLSVTGGPFTEAMPALSHHAFTLRRGSWITGRYRIADHAPFALRVPAMP